MKQQNSLPLYLRIAEDIRQNMGKLAASSDGRLPLESWFMEHYNASRVTIRKAIDKLVADGVIEKRPYKGLYAAKPSVKISQDTSFYTDSGENVNSEDSSFRVLTFDQVKASTAESAIFGCPNDEPLYYIEMLRFHEDSPYMLQRVYLRASLLPGLDILLLRDHLIHEIIEDIYGLQVSHVNYSISVGQANQHVAELLKCEKDAAVLQVSDVLCLDDGTAIRHGVAFCPDSVDYKYTLYKKHFG